MLDVREVVIDDRTFVLRLHADNGPPKSTGDGGCDALFTATDGPQGPEGVGGGEPEHAVALTSEELGALQLPPLGPVAVAAANARAVIASDADDGDERIARANDSANAWVQELLEEIV